MSTNRETTADFVFEAIDSRYLYATKRALCIAPFLKKCESFLRVKLDIICRLGSRLLVRSMIAITTELKLKLKNTKISLRVSRMTVILFDGTDHLLLGFIILQRLCSREIDMSILVDNSREIEELLGAA